MNIFVDGHSPNTPKEQHSHVCNQCNKQRINSCTWSFIIVQLTTIKPRKCLQSSNRSAECSWSTCFNVPSHGSTLLRLLVLTEYVYTVRSIVGLPYTCGLRGIFGATGYATRKTSLALGVQVALRKIRRRVACPQLEHSVSELNVQPTWTMRAIYIYPF